jgi:lipopolysaccharide transport system ATP-binding protein
MSLVENLCTRAMLLERGRVTATGSAESVVRTYLRGAMAGSAAACVDYSAPADPAANRHCALLAARIRGGDGSAPVQGEDAVLTAEIVVRAPVRHLELWVGISTAEGERVAAVNNSDYRREVTLSPGEYRIDVRMPSLRLLPRRYSASIRLQQRAGELYDEAPDALSFTVLERDVLGTGVPLLGDRGVTWIPASYEVSPQSPEAVQR